MAAIAYGELWRALMPETALVVAALAVLGCDLGFGNRLAAGARMRLAGGISLLGCLVAGLLVFTIGAVDVRLLNDMRVVDPLTRLVQAGLLVMAAFTILIGIESRFTKHPGEFFAILLMGTVGMLLLVGAEELLMLFVALELTSLSLYILVAFDKDRGASTEAALKYFLFGGMSAAVTLYGMSWLYGLSGSTNLRAIALAMAGREFDTIAIVAVVMLAVGFGFKVAAAPFHLWAPDVYQGAPVSSAAFIASGSKVASFVVFGKVLLVGLSGFEGSGDWGGFVAGWVPLLAALSALSLVLGNVVAIVQTSVRRLLAYSAIAHAGYILIGLVAGTAAGLESVVYYVLTYGVATVGAFGVVGAVQQASGRDDFGGFSGLAGRSPVLAFCLLVFLLSLAGIPPLAGFFGKFYLFAAALQAGGSSLGLLWLVVLAVGMSAVSLYYYLRVLKHVYVLPVEGDAGPLMAGPWARTAIVASAILVILLGCAPGLLLTPLREAIRLAGF